MNDLILADLDQFVTDGIQTGTADQNLAELSPLQRQLYQEQDFHYAGGALLMKVDETIDPQEGRNKLEYDWDYLTDMANNTLASLHATGFFYQEGSEDGASAEGVVARFIDEIPPLADERIARRYAIDLIKSEASAIWLEQNDKERKTLIENSLSGAALIKSAILHDLDESDPEVRAALKNLIAYVLENNLHNLYKSDPIVDVWEDAAGIHILTGAKLQVTLNNVDINSQFGGDGYSPPRDRYRLKRILKFDNQPEISKAKYEREIGFARLINDIKFVSDLDELKRHRREVTQELYSADKDWKARWSKEKEDEAVEQLIEELLAGPQEKITVIKTHTYTVEYEGKRYFARLAPDARITMDCWFGEDNIKTSTQLGQKLLEEFMKSDEDSIDDNSMTVHTETIITMPYEVPRPLDEESLRRHVWRERKRWEWMRREATVELNFTAKQWNEIYKTYEQHMELLQKLKHSGKRLNALSPGESMQVLQKLVANATTESIKKLWNEMIIPLFRNHEVKHGKDTLSLRASQFNTIRKMVLSKLNNK